MASPPALLVSTGRRRHCQRGSHPWTSLAPPVHHKSGSDCCTMLFVLNGAGWERHLQFPNNTGRHMCLDRCTGNMYPQESRLLLIPWTIVQLFAACTGLLHARRDCILPGLMLTYMPLLASLANCHACRQSNRFDWPAIFIAMDRRKLVDCHRQLPPYFLDGTYIQLQPRTISF